MSGTNGRHIGSGNGKSVSFQDRDEVELWHEYRRTQSREIRDYFLCKYLPTVKYWADRIHSRIPRCVDVEDLRSAGIFGLMDAIDVFDPERGFTFMSFSKMRIRGSIFDELRAVDWVPRLTREREKRLSHAKIKLTEELGREPTREELIAKLEISVREFDKIVKDSSLVRMVSLSEKKNETDSGKDVFEGDLLHDTHQVSPLIEVQKRDLREAMTKGLSRKEKLIIVLYYYEQFNQREIGDVLGVTESCVSILHKKVLERLKTVMSARNSRIKIADLRE